MNALAGHGTETLPAEPYPGLRPFETSEWSIFFGRERMIDEIIELLGRQRLVVVHGSSGSGKSSVIRAGVLPRLERQYIRHGIPWQTCAIRPSGGPLWNLASALAGLEGRSNDIDRIDAIRQAFDRKGVDLTTVVAEHAAPKGEHVCILIDQFEEIFRYARQHSRDEVDLLGELFESVLAGDDESARLHLVITMRSEFLGDCARFAGLAEAINRAQYLLPRMDRDALRRAIRRPAELYGGHVSERLADRLIADTNGDRDELPLIQHGLMRLWRNSVTAGTAARLDLEHYEAERGLARILSDHADTVLRSVAPDSAPERAVAAEHLFRSLIDINADGQAIRRPQRFRDLVAVTATKPEMLRSILDAFRAEGVSFVTPYASVPIEDDTVIDISHEALIRCWARIGNEKTGWLRREFQDGLTWRALLVRAGEGGFLTRAAIKERTRWLNTVTPAWTRRYGGGWDSVERLIKTSRRARALEMLLVGLIVLAIGIVTWRLAEAHIRERVKQRVQELKWQANSSTPERALLLAAEAANQYPTPETTGALLSLLQQNPFVPHRVPEGDKLRSALDAGRPSRGVATIGEGGEVLQFLAAAGAVNSLAASADGKTLAIGHTDGTITLWDVTTKSQLGGPLLGHDAPVTQLAFATDRTLVSKDKTGSVLRWPVGLEEWTKRACRLAGPGAERELAASLGKDSVEQMCRGQSGAEQPGSAPPPDDMVAVPPGWFWMGCNQDRDNQCFAGETGRRVYVDGFSIDKTEVTVAAYRRCVKAGACTPPETTTVMTPSSCTWGHQRMDAYPINCVNWFQAKQYCDWRGKRLPREPEWEKAARGEDGRKYPWGDQGFDETSKRWANIADEEARHPQAAPGGGPRYPQISYIAEGYHDGFSATAPVGSFPDGASVYGAQDMSGNVWEWVWDETTGGRGMRGGSWADAPAYVRSSHRASHDPKDATVYLGFRCAL